MVGIAFPCPSRFTGCGGGGWGGVEVAVETPGTIGTGSVCELVSWSVAGSGVIWVVGTVGTVWAKGFWVLVSWDLWGQGLSRLVGQLGQLGQVLFAGGALC